MKNKSFRTWIGMLDVLEVTGKESARLLADVKSGKPKETITPRFNQLAKTLIEMYGNSQVMHKYPKEVESVLFLLRDTARCAKESVAVESRHRQQLVDDIELVNRRMITLTACAKRIRKIIEQM